MKTSTRYPGFLDLWKFIADQTGIAHADGKLDFLRGRIDGRLRQLGLGTYADYLDRLANDAQHAELSHLADLVTIRDTSFRRDPELFGLLEADLVPGLARACAGERSLRAWSAGCASGEEPYSLAVVMAEVLGPNADRQARILATDLSPAAIAVARRGRYAAPGLRDLARTLRDRYFTYDRDAYAVRASLRALVEFERLNLISDPWPDWIGPQDLILCRNVLIYFSQEVRRAVAHRLLDRLRPGGVLILGRNESLEDLVPGLRPRISGATRYYLKPSP